MIVTKESTQHSVKIIVPYDGAYVSLDSRTDLDGGGHAYHLTVTETDGVPAVARERVRERLRELRDAIDAALA